MKKWLQKSLLLAGFFLLYRVLTRVNWPEFEKAVVSLSPVLLIGAGLSAAMGLWVKSLRWHLCFQNEKIVLRDTLSVFFASNFFGLVTPGRVGELLRIQFLRRHQIDARRGLALLIHDRFFDFLILFGGFLWAFAPTLHAWIPLLFLLSPWIHYRIVQKFRISHAGLKIHYLQYGLSFLSYAIFAFGFHALLRSSFGELSFLSSFPAVLSANLAAWLPISWNGLGVKEQVYLSLLSDLSVSSVVAVSLTHFVLTLIFSLLGSLLPLLILGFPQMEKAPPPKAGEGVS